MTGQTFAQSRHILYLNSYHVGYKWSDEEYQGFLDTLEPSSAKIALHVEYLDTKRFSSDERLDQLAEALAIKYQDIPIDLVVSTDDAAFLLLKRFGNTVFPGVPVFFCGTNYLDAEDLHDLPNFHGVTERADIDATFATILELLPQTLNIYVINDRTITGKRVHPAIEKAMAKFQGQVKFTLWEDISMAELISRVNSIPQDSVIFYTFFFQDKTGQTFEYDQAISLISRQSPVPIFGAWDFNLGLGLTGGMLTSGYQQGAAMAEMVRSWLERTPITEIPPLAESPNRFMFDYAQLTRLHIKPQKSPLSRSINPFLSLQVYSTRSCLLLSLSSPSIFTEGDRLKSNCAEARKISVQSSTTITTGSIRPQQMDVSSRSIRHWPGC